MRRLLLTVSAILMTGLVLACLFFIATYSIATQNPWIYLTTLCALLMVSGYLLLKLIKIKNQSKKSHRITDKLAAKLKEQEGLLDNIFENNYVGVAIIKMDGQIARVNQALCQLLGYSEVELLNMNFYYLIHPTDLNNLQIYLQHLIDKKIKIYKTEQHCTQKNGEELWIMTTLTLIRDADDKPLYSVAQIQNITIQKKAEERLKHMAYHDTLTGLANRNRLEQFINHILATSRRHQKAFAVLFVDLDRFKNINDTLGHEAGDTILQIVSDRLRSIVRTTDLVARLGGDEFVVVITDVKKSESVALIGQKILESILEVIVVQEQEIYLTTSIGISIFPYDSQTMQSLMKNADLALYRAKENGRNNYQFYTLEMTSKAQEKMSLQNALGHALSKNEFLLHYQPKMELKTRKISGVEALLRWKNKDYLTITPDQIVALAEETGLIIPVSEWVLRTACKQLRIWHDMGFNSLTMAINCSARQFKQGTFLEDILKITNEMNLPPHFIEFEVTEAMIMEEPDNTIRVLYGLKDLGVQIAIDDFGTGYWSLNNLRRLAVDKIKIDKTFIKQITVDETSASITTAIIAMGNKLGIKTLAEGVETKEQYQLLLNEGCAEIQGYYLTQPLPDLAMTQFLKHPIPDAEAISSSEITSG